MKALLKSKQMLTSDNASNALEADWGGQVHAISGTTFCGLSWFWLLVPVVANTICVLQGCRFIVWSLIVQAQEVFNS